MEKNWSMNCYQGDALDKKIINVCASYIIMHHELYEMEDCRNSVLLVAIQLMAMFSLWMPT